ncbi:MAG: PIG-L family deacetylase [Anaerolineae bacterium]|nr:PIG-L family deacetylase [Anaerolineae bacterium]
MHLFLSPHYDDAVYSCGGRIAQLSDAGEAVQILTLMAGIPELPLPDTPIVRDNHQRWQAGENPVYQRREEDQTAAKILGASVQYAGLLDCIYRMEGDRAVYATEESLWGGVQPHDPAIRQIRAIDLPTGISALYAPLGVGQHVDHLLVRDWALEILAGQPPFPVIFYEEYPYLREATAVTSALGQLAIPMTMHRHPLTQDDIQRKIEAMKAYRSQIVSFWENSDAVAAEVCQTFKRESGGYAEQVYMPEHL